MARAGVCRSATSLSVRDPRDHVGMVGEVLLNKVSPVALGQFAGEAVEVKAIYRIDHHPAKDHSSLEKHTGDIRVRNLIKLLRLPA